MDIEQNWGMIKDVLQSAMASSRHCSFATVDEEGLPHVTPIGSLALRDDCTGYYFEEFTRQMPKNLGANQRVCILAVNSGFFYWYKAISSGRFPAFPGVRLYGTVGERREATGDEIAAWHNRVKRARKTRGYKLIWENLKHVRDIKFDSFRPVTTGQMTAHLLK